MNDQIAERFFRVAELLLSQGESFRSSAIRRAAKSMGNLKRDITEMTDSEILEIPGFGKGILRRIREYQETGTLSELKDAPPPKMFVAPVPVPVKGKGGNGGEGEIRHKIRFPREEIGTIGNKVIESIVKEYAASCYIVGSYRRGAAYCGDCDILVIYEKEPENIADCFREAIKKEKGTILNEAAAGRVKVAAQIGKIHVDLRVFRFEESGAGLLYFTGSQEFNIKCRIAAKAKGYKLNEYGLWNRESGKRIPVWSEEEILEAIGIGFVPPERRI